MAFSRQINRFLSLNFSYFLILISFLCADFARSQPLNDDCDNSEEILITGRGFDTGIFKSKKTDIDSATREIGEVCSQDINETGNCGKTVWYRFKIPTTRNIQVLLTQEDSMIPQIFAGFTVYEVDNCDYNEGNLSNQLTPVAKFGASGNSCLKAGEYYIQVAAKTRAKGLIWVELKAEKPVTDTYNQHTTPYDLGEISNQQIRKSIDVGCLDIESTEYDPIANPKLNKSLWIKVKFPKKSLANRVILTTYSTMYTYGYRIFYGPPDVDSVSSTKPFIVLKGERETILFDQVCESNTDPIELYFQIVVPKDMEMIWLSVQNSLEEKDDWNTPSTTTFKVNTNNSYDKTFRRYLSCESKLSTHTCKNAIPDELVYEWGGSNFDTMRNATYTVIESGESGKLRVSTKDRRNYPLVFSFILYKGDVTRDCNLTEVDRIYTTSEADFCLDKDTYTLVTVFPENYLHLGEVNVRIRQEKRPANVDHYYHTDPYNIGRLSSPDDKFGNTNVINTHYLDTSLTVDTNTLTGRFIFSEFYVEKPSHFALHNTNYVLFNLILFKGKLSDSKVQHLDITTCYTFDTGYYTLVAYHDTSRKRFLTCDPPGTQILISKVTECAKNNIHSEPGNAIPLNNMRDLTDNLSNVNGIRYDYPLDICKDCGTKTLNQPKFKCNRNPIQYENQVVTFFFYTFHLDENAEVEVPNYSVLYRGNSRIDNNLCTDTNNIVDPCSRIWWSDFCNLSPGDYTLAIPVGGDIQIFQLKLVVTPHVRSPNDFAKHAYDFGQLQGIASKVSDPLPITCHTFSGPDDPDLSEINTYPGSRYFYPIPYKDTLDKCRPVERRNLWYTFTTTNAKTIQITVESKEFCKERILVYEYLGDFDRNFYDAISRGLDTTDKSLHFVATNPGKYSSYCMENYVYFNNGGCREKRYIVLLESMNSPNQLYRMRVRQTELSASGGEGDFCSNAITKSTINYGTQYVEGENACHTYGNSPFESDDDDLISTWFKVDIKNLTRFDLSISYQGSVNISGYNIYAGECGALTKVMSLDSRYAYFTLSCMTSGSYYIQAIAKNNSANRGKLRFKVDVTERQDDKCKPYNFDDPIAQFDILGGCNNDTLRFDNLSTDGELIRYKWYINNVLSDTTRKPEFLITNSVFKDSNFIKLVITNTNTGRKDSMNRFYLRDTNSYYFNISAPSSFFCYDTIELSVKTNYPYRINYEWISDAYIPNPFKADQQLTHITKMEAVVTGTSDNCFFSDTISLEANHKPELFLDTTLCGDTALLEYDLTDFPYFVVNGVPPGKDKWTIDAPGYYYLYYSYKGCYYSDTVHIVPGTDIEYKKESDSSRLCNSEPITLTSPVTLQNYLWNTGETDSKIEVSSPGKYKLTGHLSTCEVLEYIVNVSKDSIPVDFLKDQQVCMGDEFRFENPLNGYEVIYKSPDRDVLQITSDTVIIMALRLNNCVVYDTAEILSVQSVNQNVDTTACFDEEGDFIVLDGGDANNYFWINEDEFGRYIQANEYRSYVVARTNIYNCSDTVQFNITPSCIISILIPNAFSPNADGINDVFRPVLSGGYDHVQLTIYNRWGEKLFEADNLDGWDGTYMGVPVQTGVYLALIHVVAEGKNREFHQPVHVVR